MCIVFHSICLICVYLMICLEEDPDVSCSEGRNILFPQQIYPASTRIRTSLQNSENAEASGTR